MHPLSDDFLQVFLQRLIALGLKIPANRCREIIGYTSINQVNDLGNTLLHSLVMQSIPPKDKMELIECLLARGIDADLQNACSMTALHIAIEYDQVYVIPLLLSSMKKPLTKNALDRTPLHLAAYLNKSEAIRVLLSDERIKKSVALPDYTGSSALEIACRVQADDSIIALLGKNLTNKELATLPYYGRMRPNIEQKHLNQQLVNYLRLNNWDESLLSEEGQCAGWGFLYLLMASSGEEEAFFAILCLISCWDGSVEGPLGLTTMLLPPILLKKYYSVSEIFDQTLNDIVLLSARKLPESIRAVFKNKSHIQYNRIEQFSIIKAKNDSRQMYKLFSFHASYTQEQLTELLALIHQFPNSYVDIGGERHATSLFVNGAKRGFYYDSNLSHRLVRDFDDFEDLASFIIKTKYPSFLLKEEKKIQITLDVFQFHPAPAIEYHPRYSSPNGFTSLHYAIFLNNLLGLKQLLSAKPNDLNTADASGRTPFDYAVLLQRHACLDLIIELNPPTLDLSDFVLKFIDNLHDEEIWHPLGQERKDALNHILQNYAALLDRDLVMEKLRDYKQEQWLNYFQDGINISR